MLNRHLVEDECSWQLNKSSNSDVDRRGCALGAKPFPLRISTFDRMHGVPNNQSSLSSSDSNLLSAFLTCAEKVDFTRLSFFASSSLLILRGTS